MRPGESASWHGDMEQRMSIEKIDTLVVGGGQAGLAMSEHLSANGVPHLVLERYRIAERWRSERWDSLVANGPAWHDRFPDLEFGDVDQGVAANDFPPKETVADYFVAYAKKISAPIRCGVEVLSVERIDGRPGFRLQTSAGVIEANRVVAATGPFQRPIVPAMVASDSGVLQMHSVGYRNPGQLPEGGVLVVGCSRQVGRGGPGSWKGACDDCRERCTWRTYHRLSPPCRKRHDPCRPYRSLCEWRD